MRVIVPMVITDAIYTSTNLAEDNTYSAWDSGTTYGEGAFVYVASTHRIYRSVQASNTNHNPTTDATSTWWVDYAATNSWKPFDWRIYDTCMSAETENPLYVPSGSDAYDVAGADGYYRLAPGSDGQIVITLAPNQRCTHIALFNLSANEVNVTIEDGSATEIHNETQEVGDFSELVDWYSFFFVAPSYETEVMFEDLTILDGYSVTITIGDGGAPTSVGQIVIGRNHILGTTIEGTEVGYISYSRKDIDDFGNITVVPGQRARFVNFEFTMNTANTRSVERLLAANDGNPCVFWADSGMLGTGTIVYGIADDFAVPLKAADISFATLDVKGLT